LKLLPCGGMVILAPPFTLMETLLTPPASLPKPVKIHKVVPLQGTNPAPFTWFQVVCCVLAKAAVGKIAQAAIKTVAAETVISPATVSRRLCLFLRSAGMSSSRPQSLKRGKCVPQTAIVWSLPGLLHRAKVSVLPIGLSP